MKPAPESDGVFSGVLALVRDEYWLKLAGRERSRERRRAEKLWRIGKSEEVCFKARKKLMTRERERERERERALQG